VENGCLSTRTEVIATALPPITAAYSVSPGPHCVNQPVTFTNQTLVSGPSQPSFGSLITAFGTHGTVPPLSRLTFSSVQTANFSQLGDGVYQNGTAWTANNAGPSTEWAMWNYPIPRSVNRIVFWACQSCPNAAQRLPLRARLYYNDGSGWKLAKVFRIPPGTFVYDSGTFTETQTLFAQLWKLEFDVNAANAPSFGEFQVYSSSPVIGGNIQWSCDGGVTWTSGSSASCSWATAGSYTVTQVATAPGTCPDTVAIQVTVNPCGPLPTVQSVLAATPTPQAHVQLSWRTNYPIQYAILQRKADTGWVTLYRYEVPGATAFSYIDSFPSLTQINFYRVMSEHGLGALVYSNIAEARFDPTQEGLEEFIRAFPNPMTELLTVQLYLAQERTIEMRVYDAKGALVGYLTPGRRPAGFHEVVFDVRSWATGIYTLQVQKDGQEKTLKLLRLMP
jgi:hypothetical protein